MYSSTLPLISALHGLGGQRHAPAALSPRKTRYPLYRRLGGPQVRSGWVRKISPPTGTRSPDRPARRESLYRLSYPGRQNGLDSTTKIIKRQSEPSRDLIPLPSKSHKYTFRHSEKLVDVIHVLLWQFRVSYFVVRLELLSKSAGTFRQLI